MLGISRNSSAVSALRDIAIHQHFELCRVCAAKTHNLLMGSNFLQGRYKYLTSVSNSIILDFQDPPPAMHFEKPSSGLPLCSQPVVLLSAFPVLGATLLAIVDLPLPFSMTQVCSVFGGKVTVIKHM